MYGASYSLSAAENLRLRINVQSPPSHTAHHGWVRAHLHTQHVTAGSEPTFTHSVSRLGQSPPSHTACHSWVRAHLHTQRVTAGTEPTFTHSTSRLGQSPPSHTARHGWNRAHLHTQHVMTGSETTFTHSTSRLELESGTLWLTAQVPSHRPLVLLSQSHP